MCFITLPLYSVHFPILDLRTPNQNPKSATVPLYASLEADCVQDTGEGGQMSANGRMCTADQNFSRDRQRHASILDITTFLFVTSHSSAFSSPAISAPEKTTTAAAVQNLSEITVACVNSHKVQHFTYSIFHIRTQVA